MGAARISPSRGRSLLALVMAVLLVESLGEDSLFHPEWGFDSYEITIPRKLSFRAGEPGVVSPVSYLLHLKGKKHVLHLWPKRFLLPRHLRVFSFTEHGELLEDHPYIPRDCNYMGSLEGSQDSGATVSTCMGGLRGILNIDGEHYQMEPLKASSSFEHVIYLLKKEQFSNQTCGLTDDEIERQMAQHENTARVRDYSGSYMHPKYIELALIFDHSTYMYRKFNLTRVINDAILLTGIMDSYYQDVQLRIHLKALEVWTDYNRIFVGFPTLAEVLGRFVLYRRSVFNARLPADWAHLYVQRRYTDALAWSFGRVCSMDHVGSASSILDANILGPATWTSHEVGHALGMAHDEEYCQCKGRKSCIMGTGRTGFSNCSYAAYFRYTSLSAKCLNNIPGLGYVVKRCGNKIVEDDEQCDCGSKEDCQKDRCCQPNCRLRQGVNCSFGLCCHRCQFRPSGYVCRQEENECDLAEYCSGNSSYCPNDLYKQDGTPCKYKGLCFRKGCRSRFMQCQSIFGPHAREAPNLCYEAVNSIGDQYGNCKINGIANFTQCTGENSVCGRLQCINVKTIPDLPDHTTIISTHLHAENVMCWGTGYHVSMEPMGIPDIGVINDGTSCGENRVCFNRTCVDISVLKFDCLSKKCNGRGVCNNRKSCHCTYGWAPPFCEEVGFGGSVDSGPPGPLKVEAPPSVQIVSFMLLRLILLVASVIFVFFRQMIVKWLNLNQKKTPPGNTEREPSKAKTGAEMSKVNTEEEEPIKPPEDKQSKAKSVKKPKKHPGNAQSFSNT
ncbi:disintegrin and metalloproteinase domain-containing protein 30-like [Cynocephalus volans]|uniref:disintegrin and metalloproteinase domain-containing protein 30-like n=1 Tax=Cynocephalus volans TaxID=110931 RepID=UPI002FC757D9